VSTIGGALLHWWSRELDVLPLVGASAGVSGATAAAIRFVFSPGVHFGGLGHDEVVRAIPAEPLGGLWRNSRAMLFVVIWFVTNIIFGAGLVPILGEETSIAWEAHIGGFLAGLLLFPLLDRGAGPALDITGRRNRSAQASSSNRLAVASEFAHIEISPA
jgi:membrane associated rhomboid family serine protease